MAITEDQRKLGQIFFPDGYERQEIIKSKKKRFVHYTNAEAAMSIIRNKEVWMREPSCMNDFSEIRYGFDRIIEAYSPRNECGIKFQAALNSLFDGVSKELEDCFNSWWPHLEKDTYIACFSEHEDNEDITGRLSMWRAYCETTGAAVVMNSFPFFSESVALKAYTSPVAYLSDREFQEKFNLITDNILANADFLKTQTRDVILGTVFEMLKFAAVSTKHPGFKEEKEWRVLYFPTYQASSHLKSEIKVIKGDPQTIYKIPLKDIPSEGLTGIEIPSLINRIIIGPTQYPLAMWKAFVTLLSEAGVENAASKVFTSDIPLRR